MDSYPPDNEALDVFPIEEDLPVKTCPQCRRDYSGEVRFCSDDGSELLTVMRAGEGFEETRTIDGQQFGVRILDETERDRIQRSLCPNCGAWKNWNGEGTRYICKSCGAHYLYEGENVYKVLGRIDERGNLLAVPEEGSATKAQKMLEESPLYNLLSEIDKSNREHWIRKFRDFKVDKFNSSWNWPSFFFGPVRYFLKGMSGRGVLYLFGWLLISALLAAVSGSADIENNPLNMILGIGMNVFYATMGSNDYYRFCLKHRTNIPGAKRAKIIGMINLVLFFLAWVGIRIMSETGVL